jgi:hypothetical protein
MGYAMNGQGSIPDRDKMILFSIASRRALRPPSLLYNEYRGFFFQG